VLSLCIGASLAVQRQAKPYTAAQNKTNSPPESIPTTLSNEATPDPMHEAASENSRMSSELAWVFGGKSQRGWSIYLPLIANEIDADGDAGTTQFAKAVARWQQLHGVPASGVFEVETWSKMIANLQSQRIKERTVPSTDRLLTAPASEFFDPERSAELRQVERGAYEAYRRMIAEAIRDNSLRLKATSSGELDSSEKYLKIISAFRSPEYQEQLRRNSPHSGRAGLAINSPHFTGRALDLYVGGDPVNTSDSNRLVQTRTPVYRWLVKNAAKFGFHPYFYEPWHWEYIPR